MLDRRLFAAVLKQADLVYVRREGQQLYYALNTTVFQDVVTTLLEIFSGGTVPGMTGPTREGEHP